MMPPDLENANKNLYQPCNVKLDHFSAQAESKEYSACSFTLNQKRIQFRCAKITPTKIGQFVTFWKRSQAGPIIPFDVSDSFDFLIVHVSTAHQWGQFIFPKTELLKQGVISQDKVGGKRALRIYPAWDKPESKQATNSQDWQLNYFITGHLLHETLAQRIYTLLNNQHTT